jgi:hypothetical protein
MCSRHLLVLVLRACVLLLILSSTSAAVLQQTHQEVTVVVNVEKKMFTTPPTFLSHGWEPWTATGSFGYLTDPIFQRIASHLTGSVRFGGITADFLDYVDDDSEELSSCKYSEHSTFEGYECPFTLKTFDALLDFLSGAGLKLLFDVNELTGRDCTLPGPKPWQPAQYCGENPASWNITKTTLILEHIRDLGRDNDLVGFELGNELFQPPHLTKETAADDILTFSKLVADVWHPNSPPAIFAPGTNNCKSSDHSFIFEAIDGNVQGFSFHNYPEGDGMDDDGTPKDPAATVLNSTWLRYDAIETPQLCLDLWEGEGYKERGVQIAITETSANILTEEFGHGFFSLAVLGQLAEMGATMVSRWSFTSLIRLENINGERTYNVAADYFFNILFGMTMGTGVLEVSGDDNSDVLVYAHCSSDTQASGGVTLMVANPTSDTISLKVNLTTLPRIQYVLTPIEGNVSSPTSVLNGNTEEPLKLTSDGYLPPLDGAVCEEKSCSEKLTLPPLSQSFFVLQVADVQVCK